MNDDYLLAIVVLGFIAFMVLMISSIITGAIYFIALYLFQFRMEKLLLIIIETIAFILTGIITYWRISKS